MDIAKTNKKSEEIQWKLYKETLFTTEKNWTIGVSNRLIETSLFSMKYVFYMIFSRKPERIRGSP